MFGPQGDVADPMEEVRGLVNALTKVMGEQPEKIVDVLQALAKAPVTVDILSKLKCGVVVSQLKKHSDKSVSNEAKSLINKWKGLAEAAGYSQTAKAPSKEQQPSASQGTPESFRRPPPDVTCCASALARRPRSAAP